MTFERSEYAEQVEAARSRGERYNAAAQAERVAGMLRQAHIGVAELQSDDSWKWFLQIIAAGRDEAQVRLEGFEKDLLDTLDVRPENIATLKIQIAGEKATIAALEAVIWLPGRIRAADPEALEHLAFEDKNPEKPDG